MKENQNIEWKASWRDEYIKWICGFANAQGGTLFIGKNNKGVVTGVANAKKLLEDIPNKVRDILGIIIDVNLITENGKEYLEIIVEPYPYPVSYKGQYHYRSGSTKQELKGAALDKFLLQKQGKRWDAVPVPKITVMDFKNDSFELFRKNAARSGRVSEEVLAESNAMLIENLQLKENSYLKRAAVFCSIMIPNNMSQALMLRSDSLKRMLTFFIRMKSMATFLSRLIRRSICF